MSGEYILVCVEIDCLIRVDDILKTLVIVSFFLFLHFACLLCLLANKVDHYAANVLWNCRLTEDRNLLPPHTSVMVRGAGS